jgi:hypothetical protein
LSKGVYGIRVFGVIFGGYAAKNNSKSTSLD